MKNLEGMNQKDMAAEFHGETQKRLEKLKSFRARLYRLVSEVSEEISCTEDAQLKIERLGIFQHENDSHTEQAI